MSPLSDTDPEVIRWTLGRIRSTTSTGTVAWDLRLVGEFDLAAVADLRGALLARVTKSRPVSVDMCDVTFVDSSALGVFLHAAKVARENGTTFKLINLTGNALRLLDVSGTFHVLTDRKAV